MEDKLIVVAVDYSRNALLATGIGARLASMLSARLVLMHSIDEPQTNVWGRVEERLLEDMMREAEVLLQTLGEKVKEVCGQGQEYDLMVEIGPPEQAIPRFIKQHPEVLMVALGRHGLDNERKSSLFAHRFGHVSESLIQKLSVPVVCVPSDIGDSPLCQQLDRLKDMTLNQG